MGGRRGNEYFFLFFEKVTCRVILEKVWLGEQDNNNNNTRKYSHGIYYVQVPFRCLPYINLFNPHNHLSGLLSSLFHRGEIEAEKLDNSEVPKLMGSEGRT